jgi:hypothetical protein
MQYFPPTRFLARSRTATIMPIDPRTVYRHRLECWAAALERCPDQALWLLRDLEASTMAAAPAMQERLTWLQRRLGVLPPGLQQLVLGQVAALTIAARDPGLYGAGLTSDRYDTALRFFGLNDEQMHRILCYCAYGQEAQAPAHMIAARIREVSASLPLPARGRTAATG